MNHQEEFVSPLKAGIKYGTYLGLILIALTIIGYYTGWQDLSDPTTTSNQVLSWVSIAIGFIVTFLGIRYYKRSNEDVLNLGEGMSVSLFIGIFSGLLGSIFFYIFISYIALDMTEAAKNSIDLDELSEEDAEAAEMAMKMFASPLIMATINFISSLFLALVYGLIASFILKKK